MLLNDTCIIYRMCTRVIDVIDRMNAIAVCY